MSDPIESRVINIPANQIIAPAADITYRVISASGPPAVDDLTTFLRKRVAEDRRMLDSINTPVITPGQHLLGIGGGTTALVPLGRFAAHLDAVENLIVKYEVALDFALRRSDEFGRHQAAATAYMDAIKLHALEYATHPDYNQSWRP